METTSLLDCIILKDVYRKKGLGIFGGKTNKLQINDIISVLGLFLEVICKSKAIIL